MTGNGGSHKERSRTRRQEETTRRRNKKINWKYKPNNYAKMLKVRKILQRFLKRETLFSASGVEGLLGSGLGASGRPWRRRGMFGGERVLVLRK